MPLSETLRLEISEKRGGKFFGFVARSGAQEADRRHISWLRTSLARALGKYCSEHPQEIATSDSEHDRSLSDAMRSFLNRSAMVGVAFATCGFSAVTLWSEP
jgi:hypothetical protein